MSACVAVHPWATPRQEGRQAGIAGRYTGRQVQPAPPGARLWQVLRAPEDIQDVHMLPDGSQVPHYRPPQDLPHFRVVDCGGRARGDGWGSGLRGSRLGALAGGWVGGWARGDG